MRRISLWLLSTVAAVVLLFGYKTSTAGSLATSGPGAAGSTQHAYVATPSTTPTPSSISSSIPSSAPAAKKKTTTRAVTGSVAQTRWGPVQVQLTVKSGSISKVAVVQYPAGNPRDDEINSYALPILTRETVDAQSAQIDMVSGATVTSGGYLQSLQSAIDRAGL